MHLGTNSAIIDKIHEAINNFKGIVINAGAYTHYSYALRDAIAAVRLPTVEVHISKMEAREAFRQHSYVRAACVKTITGHGLEGYCLAAEYLKDLLSGVISAKQG